MPKSKSGFIDFKALKQRVHIVDVLDHYGLTGTLRASGETLVGACPICGGEGDRFRVTPEKNVWNCFGKECKGGNALDFVSNMESIPLLEAAGKIVEWLALDLTAEALPRADSREQAMKEEGATEAVSKDLTVNKVLSFSLQHLDSSHSYLKERGLTAETIEFFGLGFCDRGIMKGRVVLPVHNHDGELVAYMGRWPGNPPDGESRYKLPKGFQKSLELFNANRTKEHAGHPLIIVEGAFSAMKIHQAGFPRVVALLGSSLSKSQESTILEMVRDDNRVLLSLDADDAGEREQREILPRLARRAFVSTVTYPEGHLAPDTISNRALAELFGRCNRRGEGA